MTQQSKIRLLSADDHKVLRSGVKAMLGGTEIKVIAEVATRVESDDVQAA